MTMGVSPGRTKLTAFAYSAALAGASGVLLAMGAGYIAPENFGAQQSIILFAMVAVGGLGSIAGPILGAVVFTLTPDYLQIAKTYQEVLFAALLLGALVIFRERPVRCAGNAAAGDAAPDGSPPSRRGRARRPRTRPRMCGRPRRARTGATPSTSGTL